MPDLLILSEGIKQHEGFEENLKACLYAAEKHGMAFGQAIEDKESLISTAIEYLPGYTVTKTANTGCALIKQSVIELFGAPEINDGNVPAALAAYREKISSYGYSAPVAHHALYSYTGGAEAAYGNHDDTPLFDFLTVLDNEYCPKKRILFDFSFMPVVHCGILEYMISVYESFTRLFVDKYDIFIYTTHESAEFHSLEKKYHNILYPGTISGAFHLGYIPYQIMWYEPQLTLNRHCLKIVQLMHDVMMLRIPYHIGFDPKNIVELGINLSDGIAFVSGFSKDDFLAYFNNCLPEIKLKVIYNAKHIDEPVEDGWSPPFIDYFLIAGNSFKHKAVNEALDAVSGTEHNFIIIGGAETGYLKENVYNYKGGNLDEDLVNLLYKRCKAVIFPSLYEGFGLPAVMGLLCGKPVVLYNSSVGRELQERYWEYKNYFFFFKSFDELANIISNTDFNSSQFSILNSQLNDYTWDSVAGELNSFFEEILSEPADIDKLKNRLWVYKQIEARSADVAAGHIHTINSFKWQLEELEKQAGGGNAVISQFGDYKLKSLLRFAVKENIKRRHPGLFWRLKRLRRGKASLPKISILIPNKDSLDVLKSCVHSILSLTTYENYEIAVIENNSTQSETFAYYDELSKLNNVRILKYPESGFNYQKLINYGVKNCESDYVLQLNNDTVLLTPNWLEFMLEAAMLPDVGAVGAKLYYPDMSIQFIGGLMFKRGDDVICDHLFRHMSKQQQNVTGTISQILEVTWITGACLMVSKKLYEQAGGMDEDFVVTCGDADLSVKLKMMGKRNVVQPLAELIHDECTSRGYDSASDEKMSQFQKEQMLFAKKWRDLPWLR